MIFRNFFSPQVVSKGQPNGPANVPVTLSKAGSADVLQTVQTNSEGR